MSRLFLRPITLGAIFSILSLMLTLITLPSIAASRQHSLHHPGSAVAFATTPATTHVTLHPSQVIGDKNGPHYIFVEDGGNPDTIDVFKTGKTGLTHVGNYPTNANNYNEVYIGTQKLALSKQDKTHGNCLLLVDANNFSPPGFLDSFSINTDGALSAEVSHVQVASGGDPSEVHVIGDTAYISNPGNDFESYSVGSGCTLTFLSQATQSGSDVNFALLGSKDLVAPNSTTGNLDVYSLGSGGSITFLLSTPSQISSPDGIAVQHVKTKSGIVTNLFTGMIGAPATAQGGQINKITGAITYLTGSPTIDSIGDYGIPATMNNANSLLIQGDFLSSSLSVYSVVAGLPGAPGSMSFLQHTALPSGDEPQNFAQLSTTLFVDILNSGNLDSCHMSKTGVANCAAVAKLVTGSPFSSGIAIL